MTEDEAGETWCPFSRVGGLGGDHSYNRSESPHHDLLPKESLCIASACMAWRWTGPEMKDTQRLDSKEARPDGDGWVFKEEIKMSPKTKEDPLGQRGLEVPHWIWERPRLRHGYCGLAGKP